MASAYTKENISLQEEADQNLQEYFGMIGEIKGTTKLLPKDEEYKKLYKELTELLPNLIKSDAFILASLTSLMLDFKYFNELLVKYKEVGNVEAYLSIVKVKNTTSNNILSILKSMGLTSTTRKDVTILFNPSDTED